jgi:alkane 1-monooxygenase
LEFLYAVYAFVIIPILELQLPQETSNLEGEERQETNKSKLFDWMLYFNIPIVFGLLGYLLYLCILVNPTN